MAALFLLSTLLGGGMSDLAAQRTSERFASSTVAPAPPTDAAALSWDWMEGAKQAGEAGIDWGHLTLSVVGGAAGGLVGLAATRNFWGGVAGLPLGATAASYLSGGRPAATVSGTLGGALVGTVVALPIAIVAGPLGLIPPGVGAYMGYRRSAAPDPLQPDAPLASSTIIGRKGRLLAPGGGSARVGTLEAVTEGRVLQIRFPSGLEPVRLPPAGGRTVELNLGSVDRSKRAWIGAGIGATVGFLGGMALLFAPSEGANMAPIGALAVGIPVGGLTGALIGALTARDRWRPLVPADLEGGP